jgi:hypothetical protein
LNEEMVVLNNKPWNIEAKAHLLDDRITPNSSMFIRNNGIIPKNIDSESWVLIINGESVKTSKSYSLKELQSNFKQYLSTYTGMWWQWKKRVQSACQRKPMDHRGSQLCGMDRCTFKRFT